MYKKIVIPVDVSSPERIFLANKMIAVARKLGDGEAKYVLLNVVEEIPSYVEAELPRDIIEKTTANASAVLKSIANNAGLDAGIEVRAGRAHSTILVAAKDDEADLIVIASHHPGLKDFLLGSTAARVVRHADCSVHVVR